MMVFNESGFTLRTIGFMVLGKLSNSSLWRLHPGIYVFKYTRGGIEEQLVSPDPCSKQIFKVKDVKHSKLSLFYIIMSK